MNFLNNITQNIKQKAKHLVLAGVLGSALGSTLACEQYPSLQIKGNYPELTQQRKEELENILLKHIENNDRVVLSPEQTFYSPEERNPVYFNEELQEFTNYFLNYSHQEHAKKGILLKDYNPLSISILNLEDSSYLCNGAPACYSADDSQIIMAHNLGIVDFLAFLNHELGHSYQKENVDSQEFVSMANEKYGMVELYKFSKPIGSILFPYTVFFNSQGIKDADKLNKYQKGRLVASQAFKEQNYDLEQSLNSIITKEAPVLETELAIKLNEYGTDTPQQINFKLWEEILQDSKLRWKLRDDGMDLNSVYETISFLKVMNFFNYALFEKAYNPEFEWKFDDFYERFGTFLITDNYENPYLKSFALMYYIPLLEYQRQWGLQNRGLKDDLILYNAEEEIAVTKNYPCFEENYYQCPPFVRGVKPFELNGYLYLTLNSFNHESDNQDYLTILKLKASDAGIEFINKFFPGANFETGDFSAMAKCSKDGSCELAKEYAPAILVPPADFLKDLGEYETAKKFAQAALAVDCPAEPSGFVDLSPCDLNQTTARKILSKLEYLINRRSSP